MKVLFLLFTCHLAILNVALQFVIYIIKGVMSVYLSVAEGRPNGWADQDQLGIGTHVDPRSVLVKVKVKVIWRHLVNANKTPYRGPQGPREQRLAGPRQLRPEDGYLQLVCYV